MKTISQGPPQIYFPANSLILELDPSPIWYNKKTLWPNNRYTGYSKMEKTNIWVFFRPYYTEKVRFRVWGMIHCIIYLFNLVLDSISLNAQMIPKEDPSELVYISQILGNNCKFQFRTHKTNNFYVFFVYHEKKIFEQKKNWWFKMMLRELHGGS